MKQILRSLLILVCLIGGGHVQGETPLRLGAERMEIVTQLLRDKRVGLVVNQTSILEKRQVHLLDTLLAAGIDVRKVFAPEHGFRGTADAGEAVEDSKDLKTGVPIISIYGKNKKPSPEQLGDLDAVVFDIQDVGARFYTYISTLHYVMEACAEQDKELIVLDRPNPNDFVDGPIREEGYESFVSLDPLPLLHGLNDQAIRLYPSLCFFEATKVSVGRGTYYPFQVLGFPDPKYGDFSFTPTSLPGFDTNPLQKDKRCYGVDLREYPFEGGLTLRFFLAFYEKAGKDQAFFFARPRWFDLLAGTKQLRLQIIKGLTEEEIRATWQPGLERYKAMRKKYLLYPDYPTAL